MRSIPPPLRRSGRRVKRWLESPSKRHGTYPQADRPSASRVRKPIDQTLFNAFGQTRRPSSDDGDSRAFQAVGAIKPGSEVKRVAHVGARPCEARTTERAEEKACGT